jgi:hypothetical protein
MSATFSTGALDALAREIDEHAAAVAAHLLRLHAAREKDRELIARTDHGPTCCPPAPTEAR